MGSRTSPEVDTQDPEGTLEGRVPGDDPEGSDGRVSQGC